MTWLDTTITVAIIGFMILIIWSKLQHQSMLDTVNEIKEIIKSIFGMAEEKVTTK